MFRMKNFDNLNQNEDSSGNQWELSPEELAEIKKEQGRRELEERTKDVESSATYEQAAKNHDTKSYRVHEKINKLETSKDRLKSYYDQYGKDFDSELTLVEGKYLEAVEKNDQGRELLERTYSVHAAKSIYAEDLARYRERGVAKKIYDWVKNGFNSKRVKDSYLKESMKFMKENNISTEDEDFIKVYPAKSIRPNDHMDNYKMGLDHAEFLHRHDKERFDALLDKAKGNIKLEKRRAMIDGYRGDNNSEASAYSSLDSTAIAKSIRRNEKKKQKQK